MYIAEDEHDLMLENFYNNKVLVPGEADVPDPVVFPDKHHYESVEASIHDAMLSTGLLLSLDFRRLVA